VRRAAVLAAGVLLALAACTSGSGDAADTEDPTEPQIFTTTEGTVPVEPATIELRPVLQTPVPCDTEPDAGTVVVPSEDPAVECSHLGPVGVDDSDLSRAEATPGGSGDWVVEVEVTEASRARANELLNACAGVTPTCPTGQIAVVVDDVVISAPLVNSPNLADEPFVIAGGGPAGFSRSVAEELAARIGG
jgi:hypothetical protein